MSDRPEQRSRRLDQTEPSDQTERQDRAPRALDVRAAQVAPASWKPPAILPDPIPEPGYVYRWIRTSMANSPDNTNVSRQFREGYVPVRAEDHPELMIEADAGSRFKGNVEVGGLLLCKIPAELSRQRAEYYQNQTRQQMDSIDNNFMRESDPRMPVLRSERTSKVTFGTGLKG